MEYLIKRKICQECKRSVVRLVNDKHCIVCYQAIYYRTVTKLKRKKDKRNVAGYYPEKMWILG